MSQRIGIVRCARLCRCTMYSLVCGLNDWKQWDWHSGLGLSGPTCCGKMTQISRSFHFGVKSWGSAQVILSVWGL